jgi:hypothetical protein
MSSYTTEVDKLDREVDHLHLVTDHDLRDRDSAELALTIAKRVRRQSNIVVRALARHRDSYSPEGTST